MVLMLRRDQTLSCCDGIYNSTRPYYACPVVLHAARDIIKLEMKRSKVVSVTINLP
jgi:hypothetical protein